MRYKATAILNRLCVSKKEFVWQPKTLIKIFNWLKSLPERFELQPKQEWSEEDEEILDGLISLYSNTYSGEKWPWKLGGYITYGDVVKFLKSLRPQSHWKPSEEQMEALKNIAYGCYQNGDGPILRELYDNLKKL